MLALLSGIAKAMALVNPSIFKNAVGSRPLNTIEIIIFVAILLILTGTYAYFYKHSEINLKKFSIPWWAIAIFVSTTGISFFLLKNIYIAILIGVSIACFIYDIQQYKTVKATIASFNACFINLVLVLGFAFNGINKTYTAFTHDPHSILKFNIHNMSISTGIILLLLGLSAVYASRMVTAKNMVKFLEKFTLKDILSISNIPAFAVAFQSACLSFNPVKQLIFSWTGNISIALASAIIILSSTFLAVFALLIHKKDTNDCTTETKPKPVNIFWLILSSIAALLTGISTLPLGKKMINWQIIFWSIIAIFVTGLWIRRFNPSLFTSKTFSGNKVKSKTNISPETPPREVPKNNFT